MASSGQTAPARRPWCGSSRRCCGRPLGHALVAGHDVVRDGDAVRRAIGVALQEAAIDPLMTGRELLRMQGALHGFRAGSRARAGRCSPGRPHGGRRPPRRRLLGRHAPAARPRAGARAPAARAVPRRADDGPGPDEPGRPLARGQRPARRGHDRVPDHPVPRGGRAARRPRRDHRPRQARGRGHAGVPEGARGEPTVHVELADPARASGRARRRGLGRSSRRHAHADARRAAHDRRQGRDRRR